MNSHPEQDDGVEVFATEMKMGVESQYLNNLVRNGIGALDYSTGASLKSEDADNVSAASQSFSVLRNVGKSISYGLVASEDRNFIAVGRTTPPCLMLFDAPSSGGGEVTLKGFQFEEYATVSEDDFPALFEIVENRGQLPTMTSVSNSSDKKEVLDAFRELERSGELTRSSL